MKKSTNTLSKLKVISSLATLASIIMLVAAVPLFVNAQTGNPPTNVVAATFNSVRVDSSSGRELVIDVTWASINETSCTPVLISDPQGLALSGTGSFSAYQQNVRITDFPADGFNSAFDVQVPIENTTANNGGAVYIEDDSGLTMHSGIPSNWNELNIHPRNGLSATHSSSAVPVVIQDPEGLLVNNDIDVAGAITNGSTNPIRFWDSNGFSFANDSGTVGLSIAGNGIISNPTNSINAGFVYINDG